MIESPVKQLVRHLKDVYALPKRQKNYTEPLSENQLRSKLKKRDRNPWKINGTIHDSLHVNRLPIGDLDNWQILRINMAERSYMYPKKGMKISSVSREFNEFNGRNKDGSIPYAYQSEIPKLEGLKHKLKQIPFRRASSVSKDIFGFPKQVHTKPTSKNKKRKFKSFNEKSSLVKN